MTIGPLDSKRTGVIDQIHINRGGAKININLNTKNIFQAGTLGPNYDMTAMPKSCRSGMSNKKPRKLFGAPALLKRLNGSRRSDQGEEADNSCDMCSYPINPSSYGQLSIL